MKKNIKYLVFPMLIFSVQIAEAQVITQKTFINPAPPKSTTIGLFNEMIAILKAASVNGQSNKLGADYGYLWCSNQTSLCTESRTGGGTMEGCHYMKNDLTVLVTATTLNPYEQMKFTLSVFKQNNKIWTPHRLGQVEVKITLMGNGNYHLEWEKPEGNYTIKEDLICRAYKMPCN